LKSVRLFGYFAAKFGENQRKINISSKFTGTSWALLDIRLQAAGTMFASELLVWRGSELGTGEQRDFSDKQRDKRASTSSPNGRDTKKNNQANQRANTSSFNVNRADQATFASRDTGQLEQQATTGVGQRRNQMETSVGQSSKRSLMQCLICLLVCFQTVHGSTSPLQPQGKCSEMEIG